MQFSTHKISEEKLKVLVEQKPKIKVKQLDLSIILEILFLGEKIATFLYFFLAASTSVSGSICKT